MKRRDWFGFLAVIVVAVVFAQVALTDDPAKTATFMRLKLAHSQKLLEGIALADYKLIEKSAQEISLLSNDELWQVFQTPEYLQQSLEFRRAADDIAAAARRRNLDGAALAYMGLTMRCVECHKHVRDVRMADLGDPSSPRFSFASKPHGD